MQNWQLKTSARASMRSMIKRFLKRFGYPPEGQESAIQIVIKQAEHLADVGISNRLVFLNCNLLILLMHMFMEERSQQ